MQARFIKEIGVRGRLRIYWDKIQVLAIESCNECKDGHVQKKWSDDCPNSYGKGRPGIHNAYKLLGDKLEKKNWDAFGKITDHPLESWPEKCEACGAEVPAAVGNMAVGNIVYDITKQVSVDRLYTTPSGSPEPGDVYTMEWHDPGHCPYWDNCDGIHTFGILPNGHDWNIDSRASNCTMKENRTHRCWIKSGSLESGTLTVNKNGSTCAAGAGSILVDGWHGFLTNFMWVG